jgi:hypothetical protein
MLFSSHIPVVMVVGLQGCRSLFAAAEHSIFREAITSSIRYPDFARSFHLEGVVNVDITTDFFGNVSVTDSTGTHPDLLDYVTDNLARLIIVHEDAREKQYRLMLKFIMY